MKGLMCMNWLDKVIGFLLRVGIVEYADEID